MIEPTAAAVKQDNNNNVLEKIKGNLEVLQYFGNFDKSKIHGL